MEKYLKDIEPGTITGNFEELHTWGIVPMEELVSLLDDAIEDYLEGQVRGYVVGRFLFIMYSMRSLLDAMSAVIDKFSTWQMKVERAAKDTPAPAESNCCLCQ